MNTRWNLLIKLAIALLVLCLVGLGITRDGGRAEEAAPSELVTKTVLVSVAADGTQGNRGSTTADISPDGRFVVFTSGSTNLVANDTNSWGDVFVHDRDADEDGILDETGAISTTLVSVSSSGIQGNNPSGEGKISADGRYVAFSTHATNFLDNYYPQFQNIYLHDRQTKQTRLISLNSDGTRSNGLSNHPSISADGRFVAFISDADNLIGRDTNGDGFCDTGVCDLNHYPDVFIHDCLTGQTTLISVASDGTQGNFHTQSHPSISGDGRYVAFESQASNLVAGDTNENSDIFVHDRLTRETTRVSVATGGGQGNGISSFPSISADGRFVAFTSYANNLVSDDTNGERDIFVHDRSTGETTRISLTSDGVQANDSSSASSISANGRFVAFDSEATNLVVGDTYHLDIFVHDRLTGLTSKVSYDWNGLLSNGNSVSPAISANGCSVSFHSDASDLVQNDTNGWQDVFVRSSLLTPILVNSAGDAVDADKADGVCDTGATTPGGAPECTLRAAIETSNQGCGGIIRFEIPSSGGFPTIALNSPLPEVVMPVQIDGNWQPQGMVELDGSNAGSDAHGLNITAGYSRVQGLILNRFGGNGIRLAQGGGNVIRGNYIGLDKTGLVDQGNFRSGILIADSANNTIGGTGELERNLIAGNGLAGVMITGGSSSGNLLQNNYIGVNKTGGAALKNDWEGVLITDAPDNIIGGVDMKGCNIISGNGLAGVSIQGGAATGNKVLGNYIGVKADGVGDLGNQGAGVEILGDASGNQIGGVEPGAGNRIAFNHKEGVGIVRFSEANAILSNSIHSNKLLGIDLERDGITPNDIDDSDIGANRRQNFPTFVDMRVVQGKIEISGILTSTAETNFRLEFFSNDGFGATGDIQGKDYHLATTITTDAKGYAAFTVELPDHGTTHTATATRLDEAGQPLHTSEFTPVDVAIIGVEVTQAIQDMANSIPLIALKPTYVLVHVRALGALAIPDIQAKLTGTRGGSELGAIYSEPAAIKVMRMPRRNNAVYSFFFPLPREWVAQPGNLTVEAEVNFEPRQTQEAAYFNNKKAVTVSFNQEPWLRMRIYDVSWRGIYPGSPWISPNPRTAAGIESIVTAMYPIPVLYVEHWTYKRVGLSPFDMVALLDVNLDLAAFRNWARIWGDINNDWVFYGVIAGSIERGQADPLNFVASSGEGGILTTERWVEETGAHELGHVFGRWHTCTPEGGEWYCDRSYPHPDGTISDPISGSPFSDYDPGVLYGYDPTRGAPPGPIHATDTADIMSYAPGGRWISDYTYLGIMNRRNLALSGDLSPTALQAQGPYLLATGLISLTQNSASFDSLYLLTDVVSQTLPVPGPFTLRLLDAGENILANYPFAAQASPEIEPGEEPVSVFSLLVPSLVGTTQVQVISGTQVLATRLASSHPPTITLTAPQGGETISGTLPISWTASDEDGDDLSYVIFYSEDDGQTWVVQATSWLSETIDLETQTLPGSPQARVRVLVSDGFYTAQATSPVFTVSPNAPEPYIFLPEDGATYPSGALVSLQGSAYDREDGSLSGAALSWSSSLDGVLGADTAIYLSDLSPGWHTITLTATDSDGMSASIQVTLRIGNAIYLPFVHR